ncbi:condensation domain-containing protein [Pseudomonas sp. EL_65y_Pfl2_R95]|uniref:condensation domain-containing protein n=1 Tax=Pseudomonas sp. EL_65y_Pfl2_R95 TaxID=3088698 RepID=UPI0030D74E45
MSRPFSSELPVRYLGPFERFFWSSDQQSAKHFTLVAQIAGHTRVTDWRQALDAVQGRHPLLQVGIAVDIERQPYFKKKVNAQIPLKVINMAPDHWPDLVSNELSTPFCASSELLLRATLLHTEQRLALILSAHHAIADGLSLAFIVRDLMQAMTGVKMREYPLPLAQEELVGTAQSSPTYQGIPQRPARAQLLDRSAKIPLVQSLRMDARASDILRLRARQAGATLHGALIVALIKAGDQGGAAWAKRPVRIKSPVNVRGLLGRTDECALSIVSAESLIEDREHITFWALARCLSTEVGAARSVETVTKFAAGLGALFDDQSDPGAATEFLLSAGSIDMMVSNLGELSFASQVDGLHLESMWGPSTFMGMEGEQNIGALTVNGALHLVCSSYTPVDDLLGRARLILMAACEVNAYACS